MHVLPRCERRGSDLEMRLRHRQVDDGVDAVVGEHGVQVGVRAAAVLGDERLRAGGVEIGRTGELELRLGADRRGVAVGDVAGADEREPHRTHSSSC